MNNPTRTEVFGFFYKKSPNIILGLNTVVLGFDLYKQTQKKAMMNKFIFQRSFQISQKIYYFQNQNQYLTALNLIT